MRAFLKPLLVGLLGAIVGTICVLVGWHIALDHVAFHELDAFVKAMAPKIAKLP